MGEVLDRESLGRVLAEDGDRLYALALRVTRDRDLAAEAVQEAFAKALEKLEGFRGEAQPSTWMHRIVYNQSIDLLRRGRRERPLLAEGDESESAAHGIERPAWARPPDELLAGAQSQAALEHAIAQLSPTQRAIVELIEMEGKTSEEAGAILGVPAGTVRVNLHRARLRLRTLLGAESKGARP